MQDLNHVGPVERCGKSKNPLRLDLGIEQRRNMEPCVVSNVDVPFWKPASAYKHTAETELTRWEGFGSHVVTLEQIHGPGPSTAWDLIRKDRARLVTLSAHARRLTHSEGTSLRCSWAGPS